MAKSKLTRNTRMMRTKQSKISSLIARIALMIAKKDNPSQYKRYSDMRKKYLKMKRDIIRKNGPKATMAVRLIVKKARSGK
jgi:hypothetical protein